MSPKNPEQVVQEIIRYLLRGGAKAREEASWLMGILPQDDLQTFFRAEVLAELERKATRTDGTIDRVKLRKLFYSLSRTAEVIFGSQYVSTKKRLDAESRAAVRKTDTTL